jgi:succinate-semialdehyde dehydrogenase/glutarate-semialdehyde dehydrogenase
MIESPLLPQIGSYIDGKWVTATNAPPTDVWNPCHGQKLAVIAQIEELQLVRAIDSAAEAVLRFPDVQKRSGWLAHIAELLLSNKQELARIIVLENGKPLKEAVGEVEYAAGFFEYYAKNLAPLESRVLPGNVRGCKWTVHHRPAGVAGIITPWNFPLAMMAKKLSAALAAGCAVVTKPAPATPLSAIALWHLFTQAGLDNGRANLVIGDAEMIGRVLCSHPSVRVVSFTGSTRVGKKLMEMSSQHLKRVALELGGNAPFIVFKDADLDAAADHLIANKFRAGGQTCVCANRILVQRDVHDQFAEILRPKIAALKVGDGLDPGTDIGPLINREGWEKVDRHVRDALARGAQRLVGADPPRPVHNWGAFFPPTLLAGIRPDMILCREETFGPVVALMPFDTDDDAVRLANFTDYGLAAYVFTRDAGRAERTIRRLNFGHIGLNTGTGPAPHAPFGGMKQSGFGREGGEEGLLEYLEPLTVAEAQANA